MIGILAILDIVQDLIDQYIRFTIHIIFCLYGEDLVALMIKGLQTSTCCMPPPNSKPYQLTNIQQEHGLDKSEQMVFFLNPQIAATQSYQIQSISIISQKAFGIVHSSTSGVFPAKRFSGVNQAPKQSKEFEFDHHEKNEMSK